MVAGLRDLLRRHYLLAYDELKVRLTQRLGSAELASDALQDAWLRLETVALTAPIDRPYPYLLRIAYNLGLRSAQRAGKTVTLDDAKASLRLIDESPDPIQIQEGRAELEMLKQAMRELTPRRRAILLASRVQGIPMRTIAAQHGISQRMAQKELKVALTYCAERLEKKIVQRFSSRSRHVSDNETEA